MKYLMFLQPNIAKILVLILLMILTSLIVMDFRATSKVTWEGTLGIPFSFAAILGYNGPCSHKELCRDIIHNFNPYALMLDIAIWYLVSCGLVLGFNVLKNRDNAQKTDIGNQRGATL